MPPKSLKIDSLELDLENPRITVATSQRDAMQKILNEQKVRLVNLAESISARGLNPMDRFLVIRSENLSRFTVLEGNRRVVAMKLLKKPSLINDLEMPESFRKRLITAALNFKEKTVEPLDCFEVKDRVAGNEWIRQRHIGEDGGRGIVDWNSIASSRFTGRNPALQALDFVLEFADLNDDQIQTITGKFPLTTLGRLLATPSVREAIGFQIEDKKLLTALPAEEALKPLRRIVLDLAEKHKNVTQLKSVEQQNKYISELKSADRPNLSKNTSAPILVDTFTEKSFAVKPAAAAKKTHSPKPTPRTAIVPKSCKLVVTVPKIDGIYQELRTLQLSKHVHAIGVLLRVFIEMSVDEYLVSQAKVSLKFKEPNSGREIDKVLKNKVKEAIAHMVANGAVAKDFLGVRKGSAISTIPFPSRPCTHTFTTVSSRRPTRTS